LLLAERWQNAVLTTLGMDAVPNDAHGSDFRLCATANYLTKLQGRPSLTPTPSHNHQVRGPRQTICRGPRCNRSAGISGDQVR
jgi:hypothetical protein